MWRTVSTGTPAYRLITACLLALALAAFLYPGQASAGVLEIKDPRVDTSILFREAKLTFSGTVDQGCDVIIKVVGSGKKVVLGQNGLLPSNYVMVDNLPAVYKVISSGDLPKLSQEINADYEGLKNSAAAYSWSEEKRVAMDGPEAGGQIQKAISALEQNGSYRFTDHGLSVQGGAFNGSLFISRQEYSPQVRVEVFAVRDNAVLAQKSKIVNLREGLTGAPVDIEKQPMLFAGIFFCLTVITALGVEEILSRRRKTAYH